MVISVILGHEKTKIQNILDLGKIDVFSVRTNIYIKNKKMGWLDDCCDLPHTLFLQHRHYFSSTKVSNEKFCVYFAFS